MQKKLWTLILASCVAASSLALACGDDDNSSSSSSSGSVTDAGHTDATTSGGDSGTGDGGTPCTFASYVIGLEGQPSTSAPDTAAFAAGFDTSCPDDNNQADFASLFPTAH